MISADGNRVENGESAVAVDCHAAFYKNKTLSRTTTIAFKILFSGVLTTVVGLLSTLAISSSCRTDDNCPEYKKEATEIYMSALSTTFIPLFGAIFLTACCFTYAAWHYSIRSCYRNGSCC